MARGHKRRKPMSDINVVPYIDVMLVLLIVFMVTAPLLTQGVAVELPEAPSEAVQSEEEALVISIKADGTYYIELGAEPDQAVTLEYITEQVSKVMNTKPSTPVLLRGDKAVSYGAVVQLMTALQAAGVPNISMLSEPPRN